MKLSKNADTLRILTLEQFRMLRDGHPIEDFAPIWDKGIREMNCTPDQLDKAEQEFAIWMIDKLI